jgi:hypothetical protein
VALGNGNTYTRQGNINIGGIPNVTINSVTPSTTGGTLSAGVYGYNVQAVDAYGNETWQGPTQFATTTGSTGSVSVAFTPVSGAVTYHIYQGGGKYFTSATSPAVDIGSGYTVKSSTNFNATSNAVISQSGMVSGILLVSHPILLSAINSTATATAAQVASGYITSTSAAATTITLPTATALATQLTAQQGTQFEFTIDNTAGANTVTLALGSGFTQLSIITGANTLTVASGTVGVGTWKISFVSTTAATISRIE